MSRVNFDKQYMFIVIKFLVIIFDEKVYDVKLFSIVVPYLKFHDSRYSFCRSRHECLHKVNSKFSYIRIYFLKADEDFWRESQGSETTDLKKILLLYSSPEPDLL